MKAGVDERQYKRKQKKNLCPTKKIGLSDKWEGLQHHCYFKKRYLKTWYRTSGDAYQRELAKLGKPVDKSEWFYNTLQQSRLIIIHLQMKSSFQRVFYSLYFDNGADDALNYGGIGINRP
jgi:putative endopeptidase